MFTIEEIDGFTRLKINRSQNRIIFFNSLLFICSSWIAIYLLSNFSFSIDITQEIFLGLFMLPIFFLFIKQNGKIVSESVLINPNIGIQIETEYYNGKSTRQFFHISTVKNCFLNEVFQNCKIEYYLTFITENPSRLVIAFCNSNIKHKKLIEIYRLTTNILFKDKFYNYQKLE